MRQPALSGEREFTSTLKVKKKEEPMTLKLEHWLETKYPVATLKKAFEIVQDNRNWKNPIRKRVRSEDFACLGIAGDWQEVVREAICFYTGGLPVISYNTQNCTYLVEAEGYYKCIGA